MAKVSPNLNGASKEWPGLCGCCDQCMPSCLCSFCCIPCFAPQIGSHAGWNPNWGGCHQDGPRPKSLCSKIFVKFIVITVIGFICGGVGSNLTNINSRLVAADVVTQSNTCMYGGGTTFLSIPNTQSQCLALGAPCAWNGAGCHLPALSAQLMLYRQHPVGYIGSLFSLAGTVFEIWMLVLLFHLRRYLRTIFPSRSDSCCEDCCCTFFCLVCSVSQEARLVFKYQQNPQFRTCSLSDPGPMTDASAGQQNQTVTTVVTTTTTVTAAPVVVATATATPVVAPATAASVKAEPAL